MGVVLSFDDGYQDFVEYAMPIMARHGVRANLNIIPGVLRARAQSHNFWNARLYEFFTYAPDELLHRIKLCTIGQAHAHSRSTLLLNATRALKNMPRAMREAIWDETIAPILREFKSAHPIRMMSCEDVREGSSSRTSDRRP